VLRALLDDARQAVGRVRLHLRTAS
jgi:hypothetical protein